MLWAILFANGAWAQAPDAYPAKTILDQHLETVDVPTAVYGHPWDFERGDTEGITYFDPHIQNRWVEDGKLKFTSGAEQVTLAWGDYPGGHPEQALQGFIDPSNPIPHVWIRFRQSKAPTTWKVVIHPGREVAQAAKRTGWQELYFSFWDLARADALAIQISGPVGNEIEIDQVKFLRRLATGYYRKVIELPKDRIIRAHCQVASNLRLLVNGQLVHERVAPPSKAALQTEFRLTPANLKPYLRLGRNVIALEFKRLWGEGLVFLQGAVDFASGKQLLFYTDGTWKWLPQPAPDWFNPDFDDSNWQQVARFSPVDPSLGIQPIFAGQVQIVNPYEEKLYYEDKFPVRFLVRIPATYQKENLPLRYRIDDLMGRGPRQESAGTVDAFRRKGQTIEYSLNLGRLPQGVYRASFAFREPPDDLLTRQEEFVVVGRIPQKLVEGNLYEEGTGAELEDIIDCIDPNDPHPFYDADPAGSKIVERAGLKYRETKDGPTFFSYQVKFQHPGDPYLIAVEYPDDRDRMMNVYVTFRYDDSVSIWPTSSPGVICGGFGKFPFTNQMQELKFLHFIDTPTAGITIENFSMALPSRAAAAKIRIYHLKEIPALDIRNPGGRLFGLGMEWGEIIGATFFPDKIATGQWYPGTLAQWFRTIETYIKYLRFCGQNVVNVGCYMYDGRRYPAKAFVKDSSLERDFRNLMLRMFQSNDLSMLAGLEYTSSRSFRRGFTEEDVARGADTVWTVSKDGKLWQPTTSMDQTYGANPFHPEVQRDMLTVVDELLDKYGGYPAFKGIAFHIFPGIYGPSIGMNPPWMKGVPPLEWGYEDITIAQFEKDTKMKLPVDSKDPKRFQKRYDWLMANAKEKWIGWRCRKIHDFQMEIYRRIKAAGKDLLHVNTLVIYNLVAKPGLERGDVVGYLREMGQDPALYRGVKDLYYNRYREHLILHGAPGDFSGWEYAINPQVVAFHDRQESRGMTIFFPFLEHGHWASSLRKPLPNWLRCRGDGFLHLIAWPTPGHKYYQEAYTRSFLDSDPDLVLFCINDCNIFVGHEQEMREFAKVHQNLPREKLAAMRGKSFDPNLVVKELRKGNDYYSCVVNPGWWEATASITLRGIGKAPVFDLVTGETINLDDQSSMKIILPAYRIKTFRVKGKAVRVTSSRAQLDEQSVASYFTERIAFSRSLLANPKLQAIIGQEEQEACHESLAQTEQLVKARRYFAADDAITNWRLNQTLADAKAKMGSAAVWQVIGPFPNADDGGQLFRSPQGPEQAVLAGASPDAGKEYPGADQVRVRWTRAVADSGPGGENFVNLDRLFSPNEWVSAYAYTRLYSPKALQAILSVGSDDGIRVWLNGKLVIEEYVQRSALPGQDQAPVELKQGWNQVLVKVEDRIGRWGFFLKIAGVEGQALEDLEWDAGG